MARENNNYANGHSTADVLNNGVWGTSDRGISQTDNIYEWWATVTSLGTVIFEYIKNINISENNIDYLQG